MINLNAIGIPLFLGSIILEIIITSIKKTKVYNLKDTLANITVGISGLLVGISTKGISKCISNGISTTLPIKLWVYQPH